MPPNSLTPSGAQSLAQGITNQGHTAYIAPTTALSAPCDMRLIMSARAITSSATISPDLVAPSIESM
eukprot:CAMPEP_0184396260 /NCGR_PEP_ID=MMETSP0007-20130409/47541_1 /TAXON_ID=97485 /ORGANISM="Prymnesium parvum, Strain Texoma1" /LENGTH=66 /DNA_ID=CAMNT_0026748867 /DNA_START=168 /DNA_END=368 /DNA_ORIENTATION=-